MIVIQLLRFLVGKVVLNPIVLFAVTVLCGVIGVTLLYDAPMYAARAARAESLQPIRAVGLADSAPGQNVLLEGRISARTTTVYRSFVAYVREEYRSDQLNFRGDDDTPRWDVVERVTPPLVVALPDGEARIANDDYVFDTTAFTFREAEPTLTNGALQSRGFRVDDPVLVVGTVVDSGGERAVDAEFVYAGTRAAYLAEMRRLARQSLPLGGAFLLVGVVSAGALVWQVRRFLREVAAEQAAAEAAPAQHKARKRPRKKRAPQ